MHDPETGELRHCIPPTGNKILHFMKVKLFQDFFHTIKGLCEGLKENINNKNANNKITSQSHVIAMESFEACNNVISTQKVLINDEQ